MGQALLPHHTLVIIPGECWAPPQTYQGLPAIPHPTPNATVAGTVNVVAYAFSREPVQEDPGSCHLAVVLWVPRALLSPATAPEG